MELIKDHFNKKLALEHAVNISRAAHMIRSQVQNSAGLIHPEIYTIDILAGGIITEIRNFKTTLLKNGDIRKSITISAKVSLFMASISDQSFFKDSSISPELRSSLQKLSQFMYDSTKAIDAEYFAASAKHSKSLFESSVFQLPTVKIPDFTVLDQFERSAAVEAITYDSISSPKQLSSLMDIAGEHLGNKAHQMQELLDLCLNEQNQKGLAERIINICIAVENEARNCLIHTRKAEQVDSNAIKKVMEIVKPKLTEEKSLLSDQKVFENDLKEQLIALIGEQEKTVGKIVLMTTKSKES